MLTLVHEGYIEFLLLGKPDDSAGLTSSGVSGRLAQLVTALAQVVDVGVNDERTTQHAVGAAQAQERVLNVHISDAVLAGHDVAEIAGVALALGVLGGAVLALVKVEMGPGGDAAVGRVAELMDVESVFAGLESRHLAGHADGIAL